MAVACTSYLSADGQIDVQIGLFTTLPVAARWLLPRVISVGFSEGDIGGRVDRDLLASFEPLRPAAIGAE